MSFVGVVVESSNPGLVGKKVVGEINVGCNVCEFCRKGLMRHCPSRTVLGISGGTAPSQNISPFQNITSMFCPTW